MKLLKKSYQKILLLFLCAAAILISKRYQAEDNRYLLQSSDPNVVANHKQPSIIAAKPDDNIGLFYVNEGGMSKPLHITKNPSRC